MSRFAYLTCSWLSVGIIYLISASIPGQATVLESNFLDNAIPFTAHAIWLYLSFFIIIPICFLLAPYQRLRWMMLSFIGCGVFAGICYIIWPTTVFTPVDTGQSMSSWLLTKLVVVDVPSNCFPSLHVALTLISVWGYINHRQPIFSLLMSVWGVAICISVIQLRRHLTIDLLGGLFLAIVVGCAVHYLINRKKVLNNQEVH